MSEIGPEHPVTYRQDVLKPLFQTIRAKDSGVVVGPASMGKSRLLQFMHRSEVQQHYLGDEAAITLFVWVDHNRLAEQSEWGVFELLLTGLIEAVGQLEATKGLRPELAELRREVVFSKNALLARRQVELAAHILCQEHNITICFLLDEFDESYRTLPPLALANLRALRDVNKYKLYYILFMREHPAFLRNPQECEGFYEQLSRSVIGLGPYDSDDATRILQQLEARKGRSISPQQKAKILTLAGGHPGLMVAIVDLVINGLDCSYLTPENLLGCQPTIKDECQKIWYGMSEEERRVAIHFAQQSSIINDPVFQNLKLKGFISTKNGADKWFSPLLNHFIKNQATLTDTQLRLNETERTVQIGAQIIRGLTARQFDLLAYLYRNKNKVCSREEILENLYPDEDHSNIQSNSVDNLVRHIRKKIEPSSKRYTYLLTVRQKGYKLIIDPQL